MDFVGVILAAAVALGIPSAATGFFIRRFEKRLDAKETKRRAEDEERETARKKSMVLIVKGVGAAIALGEATAHAIQNGHPNGDMEAALAYAQRVKHEQKDFLTEQASENIYS